MLSSCAPASSFLLSIDATAEANDEMTKALSIRPKNSVKVVTSTSSLVTGSTSLGTMEVAIPAPQ